MSATDEIRGPIERSELRRRYAEKVLQPFLATDLLADDRAEEQRRKPTEDLMRSSSANQEADLPSSYGSYLPTLTIS
jgi:hypothetical protein